MILSTKKLWWIISISLLLNVVIMLTTSYLLTKAFDEVRESKEQETLARVATNRMIRSSSNFLLPGFTISHLERVTRNADTLGIPWWIPAGIGKHENGGDTLEVGMQSIPLDIRKKYPVLEWQYAGLIRMLNKQAWRVILSDPELLPKVIIPFAQIYKAEDPQRWLNETTGIMMDFRNIEDNPPSKDGANVAITPQAKRIAQQYARKNFRKKFRINPKLK